MWGHDLNWMRKEASDVFCSNTLVIKSPSANTGDARDVDLIPGLGSSPGEGNGNPLQYSCLGNPMEKGAWWATIHEVARELEAI